MIVRNWMQANPLVITSDTLVSEAKRILSENNLHALPVVDDGRLRGLVTRANLLRMGHFVLRTQNSGRVRLLRHPAQGAATSWCATRPRCRPTTRWSTACAKGRELGVAQFPVLDGERVVGVISANEIFQLAAHCLGAWERRSGLTLAPLMLGPGVLGRIADVAEAAGAVLQALYPIGPRTTTPARRPGYPRRRSSIRFHARDVRDVVAALEAAGFPVLESSETSDRRWPLSSVSSSRERSNEPATGGGDHRRDRRDLRRRDAARAEDARPADPSDPERGGGPEPRHRDRLLARLRHARWPSVVYSNKDVGAAVASGSFRTRGMIVAPCTVKTLSAIANSFTYNLVVRAADVQLKERRKLVLMVRETPLHKGHLDLMSRAADCGAVILPPMPAFYHKPEVDHGPHPPEHRQGARPGRHRARAVQALDRTRSG